MNSHPPETLEIDEEWWLNPPDDLEGQLSIFNSRLEHLQDQTPEGQELRAIFVKLNNEAESLSKQAKEDCPIAFMRLGWEQALKCNSWVWGIGFDVDFDANRKGKTCCSIINAILYILPNDPHWKMFTSYVDDWGRIVQVLQRPVAQKILKIRNYLKEHPELKGDPFKQPYDDDNIEKFASLQKALPDCFTPAYPNACYSDKNNTLWHGAPDSDYHKDIIMPEWRKWLPKSVMVRDSDYDKTIDLTFRIGKAEYNWYLVFKSYESKDTKWSGAAVSGILLTEGVKEETLDEIRQRFRNDAFGHWDYTPYEPRNVGAKTAIAHKVFKGQVELPLSPFVFSGFGIDKTPTFILPEEKRKEMISMWAGTAQGEARIRGKFFTSSPVVLTNLDRFFHTIPWTKEELFARFPEGNLYRGLDPGYDHPTACAWCLLNKVNTWFIYRIYSKAGTSIPQRCKDIIELTGNTRIEKKWGRGDDDKYYTEALKDGKSEQIISTIADYHVFKDDENTKQPYSTNYVKQGLVLVPSTTMRPRDRAQKFDELLQPDLTRAHPVSRIPPASKVYFLINEPGVAEAVERLENIFWDRYRSGDRLGEPKDEIQSHDDDEFDAMCYLLCSPVRWMPRSTFAPSPTQERFASLQTKKQRPLFAATGY
jgi:hypothetical protein